MMSMVHGSMKKSKTNKKNVKNLKLMNLSMSFVLRSQ